MRQEGTNRKLSKWQVTKYALKQGGVEPTTRDRKSPAKRNVLDDKDKEKARAGRLGGKASSRNRINRSGAIEEPQVAAVVHSTLPALSSPNRSSINTSVNSSAFIRRTTNDHDFNMELLDSFNSGATSAGFDAFNSISIYHFDSSSQ